MNDLISRQAAIDLFPNDALEWDTYWGYIATHFARRMIKDLPSAQQWIPCSERLPAKTGHYLCSFKKPNRIDNIFVDLAYWTGGRWYGYLANEINAWMPLPEPYEVEE